MSAKALVITGLALLLAGILVGAIPVSAEGSNCGSVWAESRDAYVSDLTASMSGRDSDAAGACDSLRSVVRIPVIVLIVGGLAVLLAGGVVSAREPKRPDEAQEEGTA